MHEKIDSLRKHERSKGLSGGIEIFSERAYEEVRKILDANPHTCTIQSDFVYGLLAAYMESNPYPSEGHSITDLTITEYEDKLRRREFVELLEKELDGVLNRIGVPMDARKFREQTTQYLLSNLKPEELRTIVPDEQLRIGKDIDYGISGGAKFIRPGTVAPKETHEITGVEIQPATYKGRIWISGTTIIY